MTIHEVLCFLIKGLICQSQGCDFLKNLVSFRKKVVLQNVQKQENWEKSGKKNLTNKPLFLNFSRIF